MGTDSLLESLLDIRGTAAVGVSLLSKSVFPLLQLQALPPVVFISQRKPGEAEMFALYFGKNCSC